MQTSTTSLAFSANPVTPGPAVMFCAACPMIFWLFRGSLVDMMSAFVLLGLFACALWLLSQGQRICAAYDAAEIALRPRVPRKLLGSALIGLLVAILATAQIDALLLAIAMGVLATGLGVAAFGMDPMVDKGTDNPAVMLRQRASEMTDAADRSLALLSRDIETLGDADLSRRTDATRQKLMLLMRALSGNPPALRSLRKPLIKLLQMTLQEGDSLADAWDGPERDQARARYISRLDSLIRAFETRARERCDAQNDAYGLETNLLLDRMERETAT